jgi:peptide deformylase
MSGAVSRLWASAAVRVVPDQVLRQTAKRFESRDEILAARPLLELIRTSMRETPESVALAAPQVGVSQRLFVVDDAATTAFPFLAFFNPRVAAVHNRKRQQLIPECCLSVPDVVGVVRRPMHLTVAFEDHDAATHSMELHGYWAQVVQHELDHLDGILFTDKLAAAKTWTLEEWQRISVPDVRDVRGLELTNFEYDSWFRLNNGPRVFNRARAPST